MGVLGVKFKEGELADVYHITKLLKKKFNLDRVNLLFGSDSFLRFYDWFKPIEVINMTNLYIKPVHNNINFLYGNVTDRVKNSALRFYRRLINTISVPDYFTAHSSHLKKDLMSQGSKKLVPQGVSDYLTSYKIDRMPDSYKIFENATPEFSHRPRSTFTEKGPEVESLYIS